MRLVGLAALVLAACSQSNQPGGTGGGTLVDGSLADTGGDDGAGGADAADGAPPFDGPTTLSETGLYTDIAARTLAPGVEPYSVRYELWSDGAAKDRYLYLPPGTQIDTSSMDWWKLPVGTKAWKAFSVGGKLVETRFLWKRAEGIAGWLKVAYVWDAQGSDAIAAPFGEQDALGTTHDVPSMSQCQECHDGVGDVLVGVSAVQLSTNDGTGYLSKLMADGRLSAPPAGEIDVPGEGVVEDALGYLHGNCGQCHNSVHGLAQKRALRLRLEVDGLTPEETPTYQTAIGGTTSHAIDGTTVIVVPGKPLESQLYVRMSYRDIDSMPPVGTEVVDATGGLPTIEQWILGLSP